jgi:hypothetical protein
MIGERPAPEPAASWEPYVYRFVLVRNGDPLTRGEELATLQLPAEQRAQLGALEVERAIDAERRRWGALARANGYRDGWVVEVRRERGYRRAIWPVTVPAGGES